MRHEILRAIQLEVVDLHRDGQIGDGIVQHQRVFKLPLLVDIVEFAELLVRVVALPIIQLRSPYCWFSDILMRRNWPFCAVFVV